MRTNFSKIGEAVKNLPNLVPAKINFYGHSPNSVLGKINFYGHSPKLILAKFNFSANRQFEACFFTKSPKKGLKSGKEKI